MTSIRITCTMHHHACASRRRKENHPTGNWKPETQPEGNLMTCLLESETSARPTNRSTPPPAPSPATQTTPPSPIQNLEFIIQNSNAFSLSDLTEEERQHLLLSQQHQSHRQLRTNLLLQQSQLFACMEHHQHGAFWPLQ